MADRTARERRELERRDQILATARERADAEGWAAVTTRHLAGSIGYSQPVLYGHFPGGKAEIMRAVAMDGFEDLTDRCRAAQGSRRGRTAVAAVAHAYLDFAGEHPAVYESMFQQSIDVRFAEEDTEPVLRAAFDLLAAVIGDEEGGAETEVFWGALHGVGLLERAGRMRAEHREARVATLAVRFAPER